MYHPIRVNTRRTESSYQPRPKTLCVAGLEMAGRVLKFESGRLVKFNNILGSGHYSVVYEAELYQSPSESMSFPPKSTRCACKIVDPTKLTQLELAWLSQEVDLLRSLRDVAHVSHLEAYEESNNLCFIFTTFIDGCTLAEYKKKMNEVGTDFSESQIKDILCQLLKVVSELHKRNVVHRDIKPENILVSSHIELSSGKTILDIYVCDFGLSCICSSDGYMDSAVGTPLYAAPEVYAKRYNYKCDLWSIGIVLLWLTTDNKEQFCPYNMNNYRRKGMTQERYIEYYGVGQMQDAQCCEEVISLFRSLCRLDLNERFSADQALVSPYLA